MEDLIGKVVVINGNYPEVKDQGKIVTVESYNKYLPVSDDVLKFYEERGMTDYLTAYWPYKTSEGFVLKRDEFEILEA